MLALAGLVANPVVARAQLICKYTGAEITNCAERSAPPVSQFQDAGCCLQRVSLPLPASTASASLAVVPPVAVLAFVAPAVQLERACPAAEESPRCPGPPLFVQHRALLI